MSISIPTPTSLLQVTWMIIGFMFGRALGKQLDQEIQATTWFNGLDQPTQNMVKRLLDFLHHFWIGLLLMTYFNHVAEVFWFGVGLFLDDMPDVPKRFARYFNYLGGEEE